jgi:hypothetical protein
VMTFSRWIGIPAHTIYGVVAEYVDRRRATREAKLRWRGKCSLGWIPCVPGDGREAAAFAFDRRHAMIGNARAPAASEVRAPPKLPARRSEQLGPVATAPIATICIRGQMPHWIALPIPKD